MGIKEKKEFRVEGTNIVLSAVWIHLEDTGKDKFLLGVRDLETGDRLNITCIHSVLRTDIAKNIITMDEEELKKAMISSERLKEGELKKLGITSEERYFALCSYVQGIAEAGLNCLELDLEMMEYMEYAPIYQALFRFFIPYLDEWRVWRMLRSYLDIWKPNWEKGLGVIFAEAYLSKFFHAMRDMRFSIMYYIFKPFKDKLKVKEVGKERLVIYCGEEANRRLKVARRIAEKMEMMVEVIKAFVEEEEYSFLKCEHLSSVIRILENECEETNLVIQRHEDKLITFKELFLEIAISGIKEEYKRRWGRIGK